MIDLFQNREAKSGPVTCLGMTFENDEARRAYFTKELRKKLKDPEFRKQEGFPQGPDDAILAMSDPPYYTACPNPWLADFVVEWEAQKPEHPEGHRYHRDPFAADVIEGKIDPIYRAHAYHSKVPHKAIVPLILHYTRPGDIVLDGFAGSGMTGVAAQWCGAAPKDYRFKVEADFAKRGLAKPEWGARRVILNDLSPAATFIAANYNLPFDVDAFAKAGEQLLKDVEQEIGWMYETLHSDGKTKGRIEYTVWSEVFTCPDCAGEVVFLDESLDKDSKRLRDAFPCPHCGAELKKSRMERVLENRVDPATGQPWKRIKFKPSLIVYKVGKARYEKEPDDQDLATLARIEAMPYPDSIPRTPFPVEQMADGSRMAPKGFTHVHHLFLPRAAQAMGKLWEKSRMHPDARIRAFLLFMVEQSIWGFSLLNCYGLRSYSQVNQNLPGFYYVPSQCAEASPEYNIAGKIDRLAKAFQGSQAAHSMSIVNTGTTACLSLPDASIDYVFTDPPFGENIFYADLNFLVESWHGVTTDAKPEAIIDRFKNKNLPEYQHLMQRCFAEYYRVLKPGRWITVVFSNSKADVLNAFQVALQQAGFVVADVRILDKQQRSYRQLTSTSVKHDLIISAYKPNGGPAERFSLKTGTQEGVWDFIRTRLKQLPVFVSKDGQVENIAERQNYLLFDRMVAFHILHGVSVPLSATEFYAGLAQRFIERDGMFFLPDQAAEYDKKRAQMTQASQMDLFVMDPDA